MDELPQKHSYFYPRSPRGERLLPGQMLTCRGGFLSTLPARGATRSRPGCPGAPEYFYPRSPRGERRIAGRCTSLGRSISIHAPREGSDLGAGAALSMQKISIHAPREGSDLRLDLLHPAARDFYPRSPRGERPVHPSGLWMGYVFLSTLPARGATYRPKSKPNRMRISIHAPREGSDSARLASPFTSPTFLSTLPARGATPAGLHGRGCCRCISIHAPREGSDNSKRRHSDHYYSFLSTLPARGATTQKAFNSASVVFLSTLPARGATARCSGSRC